MPQFDVMSFFVQIFWTTILFFVMHLVYLYLFLPNTSSVLKFREKILVKLSAFSVENYYTVWSKSFNFYKKKIK